MPNDLPRNGLALRPDRRVFMISALLLAGLALPSDAVGQVVRGTLVGQDTGMPIEGAAIVMLGPDGRRLGWSITDGVGRYYFRLKRGWRFVLRVDRIGYASTLSEDLQVGVGDTLVYRIEATPEAVKLPGLSVDGSERGCELRPEEGTATARVWEEARKALEVASQTTKAGIYDFAVRRFVGQLDTRGRRVRADSIRFYRRLEPRPFVSLEASRLTGDGFVQPDGDESIYYAPDADVLLSDEFLDSHCFRLGLGKEENEGLLGLEFEPMKGRDVPEISGTIWIDGTSAKLQRVDFRYEHLGFPVGWAEVGGTVVFSGLPNGRWFVRRWSVRMPVQGRLLRRGQVVGIAEEGGVVLRVFDEHGELVFGAGSGTIAGVVVWEDGGSPVSGAVVDVWFAGQKVITDGDGLFRIGSLEDGTYDVRVTHPTLSELGYRAEPTQVEVVSGEVTSVRFTIPSEERVERLLEEEVCLPMKGARGIVAGTVSNAETGEPIQNALVELILTHGRSIGRGIGARSNVPTRFDGFFAHCGTGFGMAFKKRFEIRVSVEGMRVWRGIVWVARDDPVAHVAVRVRPDRVLDEQGDLVLGAGSGTIAGVVVREDGVSPVSGAVVDVWGAGQKVITDADGLFLIGSLEDGTYDVRVTHPTLSEMGYRAEPTQVEVVSGEVTSVRFTIPSVERVLEEEVCLPTQGARGIVAGTVSNAETGEPIEHALVELIINAYGRSGGGLRSGARSNVPTGFDGFFVHCGTGFGMAFKKRVEIRVSVEGMRVWRGTVWVSRDDPVAHVAVHVEPERKGS